MSFGLPRPACPQLAHRRDDLESLAIVHGGCASHRLSQLKPSASCIPPVCPVPMGLPWPKGQPFANSHKNTLMVLGEIAGWNENAVDATVLLVLAREWRCSDSSGWDEPHAALVQGHHLISSQYPFESRANAAAVEAWAGSAMCCSHPAA